jgi:transcription elongation GreA/GreB family factor
MGYEGTGGSPRRYLTRAGLHRLRGRIAEARAEYAAVCAGNEEAAGAGDSSVWHDNFAYEENQRQMHRLARRVRDLEEQLAAAEIVPACASAPDTVRIGARVRVRYSGSDDEGEREATYYIAGFDDGDPSEGRISYTAPLAARLIGAEVGDVRAVPERAGSREVEVVELLPATEEELP